MARGMEAVKNLTGGDGRKTVYSKQPIKSGFENLTLKEKLGKIVSDVRTYDQQGAQRRNATCYRNALYYQGFQDLEFSADGTRLDVYEKPDFYVENQYRRHVDAVKNMLNDLEPDTIAKPETDKPKDVAAARAANPALEIIKSNISYEQLKDRKNLYKCLFGTAYIFTDYIVDKQYGTVTTPKYRYEEMTLESEEEGMDPLSMMSKVPDGFETRSKGMEIAHVYSPLEVRHPTNIRGGIENLPWLQLIGWHDIDAINDAYPGLNATPGSDTEQSLAKDYLSVLSGLQGNTLGAEGVVNISLENQAEVARTWVTTMKFRGDKELLRLFPNGVHITTVNGLVVDYYGEDLCDRWTMEVLIPLPHSILGDGLHDIILEQDSINESNSLFLKYVRGATLGHNLYNPDLVDPNQIVNDPENVWVPGRPGIDQKLSESVFQIRPAPLGQEVAQWMQLRREVIQEMSSAYDPSQGKGLGANTPYSQSVFLAEKSQARWKSSANYNRPELLRFWRQLLKIAQQNWIDERTRALQDNTGQWTMEQFTGASLEGGVDIHLTNSDFKPKTRAEKMQALEQRLALEPIWMTLPPKQRLQIETDLGLPPDANPISNQVQRAHRMVERIKKGEPVTPLALVDQAAIQVPIIQDWLISEEAEELGLASPEIYSAVYDYMITLIQMDMMAAGSGLPVGGAQPMGMGAQPSQPSQPGQPGGQPGQQGGGAKKAGAGQEMAQSPSAEKQPAPPYAPGAR